VFIWRDRREEAGQMAKNSRRATEQLIDSPDVAQVVSQLS